MIDKRQQNRERLSKLKGLDIEIISWQEIEDFIDKLSSLKKYDSVYGIPRGGLLLAIMYSYKNNVPLLLAPKKGCLVIDDDIGTGLTITPFIGKYDTAVMYSNAQCEIKPTYVYKYYDEEKYKVFAWNKKEDLR